jgi:acyl-CoA synthetase (AMP-forming)/AMP-acid ligase II
MTEVSTIPAALHRAAAEFGDAEALVDGTVRFSWRQLLDEVRAAAAAYVTLGVQPGDRVAVWAPNTQHWVIAALGAHYAGATLVPINTRYTAHEALDVLTRTKAKVLVATEPFLGVDRLGQLRELCSELPATVTIAFDQPLHAAFPHPDVLAAAEERAAAVSGDDVSDILFTSGTTGRSKGVLSAHRQVIAVAAAWTECGEVTAADRYLVINPFFHSFGYKAGIVACLLTGATIVPQAVYDVPTAMRLVQDERITVLPGAPTIFQTILDSPDRNAYDLSSLRFAVTGAAVVPVALVERMQQELSFDLVLTAFGMTEAVVVTMCRRGDPPAVVARTCGRAVAGCATRIGEQGELLVRGPNVMLGYLDDPVATAAAIDDDGWLHTGDVGTVDDGGYLRITDRLKDMYISGGFNVYPAEVEQTLARLPGVADAAVIGVPDGRMGEVGLALVVRNGALTEEDVRAFCQERLANYKVPRTIRFVDALPRNLAGKVLKAELRKEYA